MKQAFYYPTFIRADGGETIVFGFPNLAAAEAYGKDDMKEEGYLEDGAKFSHIERMEVEVTPERVLRSCCIICGEYIGSYQSSMREWKDGEGWPFDVRRCCREHAEIPPGYRYYTDG